MLSQLITVKGDDALGAAGGEAGKDEAEGGFRRGEIGGVGGDIGVGGIEALGGRIDVVAALGDGQRDDADGGIG